MRYSTPVGVLPTKDTVAIRRAEDGSINIVVYNNMYKATYQRTPSGNFLLSSTYPKDKYAAMAKALDEVEVEIERRCIELTEAELRIDYKPVMIDEGQTIKVGQSNSLTIFIVVEDFEHRALFHYDGQKVRFIRSSYLPEDGAKISAIIKRNFSKISAVMEENGMIEATAGKSDTGTRLYKEGFSSTMTEEGKEERRKVDSVIEDVFRELESKEYSNLEIQAMLLESVFEIALQYRSQQRKRFGMR